MKLVVINNIIDNMTKVILIQSGILSIYLYTYDTYLHDVWTKPKFIFFSNVSFIFSWYYFFKNYF